MVLIILTLTYDNQSTLSSFSLFMSFVIKSPVAEKALSASTDVGLIVIKIWYSFSTLFDLFFAASKRLSVHSDRGSLSVMSNPVSRGLL